MYIGIKLNGPNHYVCMYAGVCLWSACLCVYMYVCVTILIKEKAMSVRGSMEECGRFWREKKYHANMILKKLSKNNIN